MQFARVHLYFFLTLYLPCWPNFVFFSATCFAILVYLERTILGETILKKLPGFQNEDHVVCRFSVFLFFLLFVFLFTSSLLCFDFALFFFFLVSFCFLLCFGNICI